MGYLDAFRTWPRLPAHLQSFSHYISWVPATPPTLEFQVHRLCSFLCVSVPAVSAPRVCSTRGGPCGCLATIYFVPFLGCPHFCLNSHTFLVLWFELISAPAKQHGLIPRLQSGVQMTQLEIVRHKMGFMWKTLPDSRGFWNWHSLPLLQLMCAW